MPSCRRIRGTAGRFPARVAISSSVVSMVVVALAACGGGGSGAGGAAPGGGATDVPPTATATATATSTLTSTLTSTVKGRATTVTLTTVTARRSALDGLRGYLARVAAADTALARAARLVNGDIVASGMRIRPQTRAAITAIELDGVARALPAGAGTALTGRALLVYSELASRRAAFQGVLEVTPGPDGIASVAKGSPEQARIDECLANGARAAAGFAGDVAALRALASSSPPFTAAPERSRATGEILVRTTYIDGWNRCCGSCGGYVTDKLAPVVWAAENRPNGEHVDGTIDGVGFEASYRAGSGWKVVVHAG